MWYSPIYKPQGATKARGSVSVNNKLRTAQRKPVDLLMNKLLYRAALRLCSLPKSHPLHAQLRSRSICRAKRHLSPIHTLLHFANLDPKRVETISPVRRSPSYKIPFSLKIPSSKDAVLSLAQLTDFTVPVCVYSDGSSFNGGIGALAILYLRD